jgi:hypothetical protein
LLALVICRHSEDLICYILSDFLSVLQSLQTHMGSVNLIGMLDSDDKLADRARLTVKRALNAGSSKQGNARRASVGEN